MLPPPHPSVAVVVHRVLDPPFLLLRRGGESGGWWQPVTGKVEEGETPAQAALREVEEETGIRKVLDLWELPVTSTFRGFDGRMYEERGFAALVEDHPTLRLSFEHTEARWVGFEEALRLLCFEENRREISWTKALRTLRL